MVEERVRNNGKTENNNELRHLHMQLIPATLNGTEGTVNIELKALNYQYHVLFINVCGDYLEKINVSKKKDFRQDNKNVCHKS